LDIQTEYLDIQMEQDLRIAKGLMFWNYAPSLLLVFAKISGQAGYMKDLFLAAEVEACSCLGCLVFETYRDLGHV